MLTGAVNGLEESPLVADYTRSAHRLTLTNGSVVVLGAADIWNRYAGAEDGAIWLDEPSHYDVDLHDLLETTCFGPAPKTATSRNRLLRDGT